MTAKSLTPLPVKRWNIILLPSNVGFRNLRVMKRTHEKQYQVTRRLGDEVKWLPSAPLWGHSPWVGTRPPGPEEAQAMRRIHEESPLGGPGPGPVLRAQLTASISHHTRARGSLGGGSTRPSSVYTREKP